MTPNNPFQISGLSTEEVLQSRLNYGDNKVVYKKQNSFVSSLVGLVKEPMVILLFAASFIYLISGEPEDALFLTVAIVLVATISIYQDYRSKTALEKLKEFTQPVCKVIRDGEIIAIKTEDLVIGDFLIAEEGTTITADGMMVKGNDFSVNEAVLTGESFAVLKNHKDNNEVYQGSQVASGMALIQVIAIGKATKLGKIGKSLGDIEEEKTPLEIQIGYFVKRMVIIGALVFAIVWALNYLKSYNLPDSLLKALTLAMSILPEEIPVAFVTFMALGAWRLMKMGIVVKQMKTVETLGSATVICTDKTGTLTENKMALARLFLLSANQVSTFQEDVKPEEKNLIEVAMWASEPNPFDPMEIALHQAYQKATDSDKRPDFQMYHEYPLGGKPPMMTHVFENQQKERIIAAKGAPEAIMTVCQLTADEKNSIQKAIAEMAFEGFRVLGVAKSDFKGDDFPQQQQDFDFQFVGLVAFYDPPKSNISEVLHGFYQAGIKVKIVTGDNALTTKAIAKEIDFKGYDKGISGDELMQLNDEELAKAVQENAVFTRMFPEAKLKIINALKSNQEIVAMTGDGVNDGPALKASHIGIAMGKKGTEIAKQAASLILVEDDLSKMLDAIAMGRRIYTNLKKAIQYIISIHIPIILTVFIPLALGWLYPNIFSPIHVIFLELIMGPTCSIIYENEPIEQNSMLQAPRPFTVSFFNGKELFTSVIQGLVITAGTLFVYQYAIHQQLSEELCRTMVFTTLIFANIFLTLANRSFYYSIFTTLFYKNSLVTVIITITLVILFALLYIPAFTNFFEFESLDITQLLLAFVVGFISVIWFEVVKWWKRRLSLNLK
ncbi:cation-translocating P-type ATPase [Pedobacter puniceum]|uniref:HAD-IC family P-type ATPase n=1 Tax=Pedobacter puniceum TaxID=2666136 RepID=A0A7K0FS41_9SPHI|nr:cation-translocating P-type ATPase [Pedobacter puniceum]MRX48816.1 HAD-IC family P-type ATPase [Pedobacter puniceum]